MLCTIAIRRVPTDHGIHYALRVSGKTSLGPSGTGGQEVKELRSAEEVHAMLHNLGVDETVLAAANEIINDLDDSHHFIPIAQGVQIPFDQLERADIYLFD